MLCVIMAFSSKKNLSKQICAAAAVGDATNKKYISNLLLSCSDNNNNNEISELNNEKNMKIMFSGSKINCNETNDSNANKSNNNINNNNNNINEKCSFHLNNKKFNDRRRHHRHIHNLVLYFFIFILINVYIDGINAQRQKQQQPHHNHHHHHHPDHQQQQTEKHFVDIHKTANFYNNEPSKQFSKYTIIKPKLHHGRHKREISNTLEEEGTHASHIKLNYEYLGKDVILDLVLNYDLIPHNHFMSYQTSDGDRIKNFTKTDVDLCHYKGNIRNIPNSRVALSTCNGVKGIVYDGIETFYIDLPNGSINNNNNSIEDDHHLYKHSDMIYHGKCGYEGGINKTYDMNLIYNNHLHTDSEFNRILRYKRSTTDDTELRGPYNANKNSAYVELVLVVDNKVFKTLGSLKKVHSHCKDIANIINALYVPLNLFIALVGIVVWNEINEVELSSDGDTTLKNFLLYRKKVLVKKYPNDNAQLLTKEQFEGGVVGKALKGPICTYEFSGGVSMDHSQIVSVVATTVAHEMGHNFGMEHDTSDCKCIDERCIMSASSSSVAPLHWSSCSIDQLNLAFHHGMNYCLRNKPTKLFESPQCGNGFVEVGEQCDCGLPEFCENTCCNPQTCMLHSNASCATGECCDLQTCHPRSPGTMCRAIEGECDLPEYCTGESEYCPLDHFKRDTESCNSGNAYCYEGSCRSRNDQCKLLWGPSGQSSEQCYEKNIDGSRHGNCGYDRINNVYINCSQDDILCGMLHCRHLNERLEFGMESVAVLSHTFISYAGNVVPCRTAIIDLGLESVDPGLTPNGAICGVDRMCVNRKCMAIVDLRATGIGIECPENCSGHGVCDNKGYCHCDIGWAPPLCNVPGPGGSEHSGPATNINESAVIAKIMYIFFLGVVPSMIIILCTIYYCRHLPLVPRKASIVTKNHMKSSTQNGMGPTSPTNQHLPTSTPSSTDDMNSSLLKADENKESLLGSNIFGQFKGFTLKPLSNTRVPNLAASNVAYVHPVSKNATNENTANGVVPSRLAPPVPKPPISTNTVIGNSTASNNNAATTTAINVGRSKTDIKSTKPILQKFNTLTTSNKKAASSSSALPPALPPFNPGSCPRPLISSPILEASTCSAKELRSPLTMKQQNVTVVTDDYTDKHPMRPAPAIPHVTFEQPNKMQSNKQPDLLSNTLQKNSKDNLNSNSSSGGGSGGGTIKRIASFLMKDDKKSSTDTLQRNPSKIKPTIDKEKLKNIEISAPIPHVDTSDSEQHTTLEDDVHSMISRTQSMRSPTDSNAIKRPNIHTFGSMRQPSSNSKRPGSVVIGGSGIISNSRPKSPPPPRPPAPPSITNLKIPGVPGYQNPPNPSNANIKNTMSSVNKAPLVSHNEYDDCEAIETSVLPKSAKNIHSKSYKDSDNIYSVIDEYSPISLPASTKAKDQLPSNNIKSTTTKPSATDGAGGLGLLGEIVNEIENRNLDSIYSVSTLNRKKKKHDNDNNNNNVNDKQPSSSAAPSSPYVNTSDINDSDSAEYIAVKSNASTTSSGYLRPTAIQTPIARIAPVKPNHDAKSKYLQQNTNSIDTINNNNNNNSLSSFRTNKDNVNNSNNNNNNNNNQRHSIEKDDDKKTITNRYLNKTNNQSLNTNTTGKLKTNNNVPEKPPFTTTNNTNNNNNNKMSSTAAATASATINRTKSIPTNSQPTINSIRTRSPSPSSLLTSTSQINRQKSVTNTTKSPTPQRKLSNTKPPIIGGASITASNINNNNNKSQGPDLVNSITTTINKSKSPDVINNNISSILSQKPKPLAKPTTAATPLVTSSNVTTAINTPSTSTSNNTHGTTKKWQPQSTAQKFNTENKILNNINNNKLIGNGQIRPSGVSQATINNPSGAGGVSSSITNKSSNIASLQQKFENTNKDPMITKK